VEICQEIYIVTWERSLENVVLIVVLVLDPFLYHWSWNVQQGMYIGVPDRPWQILLKNQTIMLCSYAPYH